MKKINIISANTAEVGYWSDLWRYRELLLFLAWRDIVVRYKQTVFGLLWALIRPISVMIIFTFIFQKVAKFRIDSTMLNVPYSIFVLAGLVPWLFFSNVFSEIGASLQSNASLISKIYFPRFVIPSGVFLACILDFIITLILLILLMIFYKVEFISNLFLLPFFIISLFIFSFGCGLWISALNMKYRDFRYMIPFIIQIGLYMSPIGFSSSLIPDQYKTLYSLNPMVGIIDGFRWSFFGNGISYNWSEFWVSLSISLIILISGVYNFRKTEKFFADLI